MSTAETSYAAHLDEWQPSQPELRESHFQAETIGRGEGFAFDRSTTHLRYVVEAS